MFSEYIKKNFIEFAKEYVNNVVDGYNNMFYNSYEIDKTIETAINIMFQAGGYDVCFTNKVITKIQSIIADIIRTGESVDIKLEIGNLFSEYETEYEEQSC